MYGLTGASLWRAATSAKARFAAHCVRPNASHFARLGNDEPEMGRSGVFSHRPAAWRATLATMALDLSSKSARATSAISGLAPPPPPLITSLWAVGALRQPAARWALCSHYQLESRREAHMLCKACGARISDDSRFCKFCGTPVSNDILCKGCNSWIVVTP